MATSTNLFANVPVTGRDYHDHYYRINIWQPSGKVDLTVRAATLTATLKMTKQEAEELVIRLQYALYQIDNPDQEAQ